MATAPQYFTLPKLFESNLFRVPDYQRGYAWTSRQLDDLWSDLELLDGNTHHFTGMIVVERKEDRYHDVEAQPYRVLEVIDGQQRLTTMVLLMLVITSELGQFEEAASTARHLREKYIGTEGWFRLALNADARSYFEQLLTTGVPGDHTENGSQSNIKAAVARLTARIERLGDTPKARLEALRTLLSRLNRLGNLTVTHYNQALSKKSFSEKKGIYARSSLVIENSLQHVPKWKLSVIDEREDELVAFVLSRWPLPSSPEAAA